MVYNLNMKQIYTCSYPDCGRIYVNSSILKRHVQAFHLSVKKFQCAFCGKCLASRQNLKEHNYIHTGEKPYVCNVLGCGASFRQGTHLSAHKKIEHSDNQSSSQQKHLIKLSYLTHLLGNITEPYEKRKIWINLETCDEVEVSYLTSLCFFGFIRKNWIFKIGIC